MSETLYASPGATVRLETYAWTTSQVGTIGIRIRSLADRSDAVARTTAGIAFDSTTGAHWIDTIAMPATAGDYDAIWDTAGPLPWPSQRIIVTGTALAPLLGGGRASMTDLLQRVRLLIHDQAGASQVFSDAQLQQWLDQQRIDVRYLELAPEWQVGTQKQTQWFSFYDQVYGGNWETDAVITDRSWNPITADTADWLTGKWTWNASQFPPLSISGRTYDVYAAAADALDAWAANVALDFDVSTGRSNLQMTRSQKHANLLKTADRYRRKQRTLPIDVLRSDT